MGRRNQLSVRMARSTVSTDDTSPGRTIRTLAARRTPLAELPRRPHPRLCRTHSPLFLICLPRYASQD